MVWSTIPLWFSYARVHFNIWVLWFGMNICIYKLLNMRMCSSSWMLSWCILRSFVSFKSISNAWLFYRHSVYNIVLILLAFIVLSNNLGCNIGHVLFVWSRCSRFCIGWINNYIWCRHWRISTTNWMFSWVPSCISCMRISISLCMSTTLFLMKNSLEISSKFTTFIHFWIHYSIVSMKSFVKLNISELLFNSSMGILCHTSTISLSCSCTWTVLTSYISTS